MKLKYLLLLFILLSINLFPQLDKSKWEKIKILTPEEKPSYKPQNGFVPDENTALKIAEAVLTAIYGAEEIANHKPFKITLRKNKVWIIRAPLRKNYMGWSFYMEIQKKDGKILKVVSY